MTATTTDTTLYLLQHPLISLVTVWLGTKILKIYNIVIAKIKCTALDFNHGIYWRGKTMNSKHVNYIISR